MLRDLPGDSVEADVAARIRARRVAVGLTQKELADRLGISEHKVLNFETCRARPHLGDVLEIAGVLGVPAAVLLESFAAPPPVDWYFAARAG